GASLAPVGDMPTHDVLLDYKENDLLAGSTSREAAAAAEQQAASMAPGEHGAYGLVMPHISMRTDWIQKRIDFFSELMSRIHTGHDDVEYRRAREYHQGYVLDLQRFSAAEQSYELFTVPANLAMQSYLRASALAQSELPVLDPAFAAKHR